MKEYGTFDILGPIMIGPSSSHTAGAARLGKIAADIAGDGFNEVEFHLHGSFAQTYQGHGTDKALVAGILGMDPADPRIKTSMEIARVKDIGIKFIETDLGYEHPNTVKIVFKYKDKDDYYIIGSSIGGGSIIITNINGNHVEFKGNNPTILLTYSDRKGVISYVSSILAEHNLNIASMRVTREGIIATMICEIDSEVSQETIDKIGTLDGISYIKFINPIRS